MWNFVFKKQLTSPLGWTVSCCYRFLKAGDYEQEPDAGCRWGSPWKGERAVEAADFVDDFYDFAFCHSSKYELLAQLADEEDWGSERCVLTSYLRNLYKRVAQIVRSSEGDGVIESCVASIQSAICFNTGLYTSQYESIYVLLHPNQKVDARQKWYVDGFYKESDVRLSIFETLPQRVRFYENPADLIYDYHLEIRPNIGHILTDEENLSRLPVSLQAKGAEACRRRLFEGAVAEASRRVAANYALAVPQYFNGQIQLLLPLALTGSEPELALAIQRKEGHYLARTCLTLEMAYSNARLIVRPESSWLVRS